MSPSELVDHWRFRAQRMQLAHYESARRFDRLHLWLGLPAIAMSTIVGTAVFATLSRTANVSIQILVGLMSVAAAVLTGLQTFLKYSELSERHHLAGAKFANLKHRIELLATLPPVTEVDLKSALASIEETWSKLREESPTLPQRVWRQIEQAHTFEDHQRRYPRLGRSLDGVADQTDTTK